MTIRKFSFMFILFTLLFIRIVQKSSSTTLSQLLTSTSIIFSRGVSKGPPVTIGWDHITEESHDLTWYENQREGNRRPQAKMKMNPAIRTRRLRVHGNSWEAIRISTKKANISRNGRRRTAEILRTRSLKVEERLDKCTRFLRKLFQGRKKKEHAQQMRRYSESFLLTVNSQEKGEGCKVPSRRLSFNESVVTEKM